MTRLVLLRHGATDWNRDGRYQGQADPPLNAEGWEQARRVAERLDSHRFEAIYSSDLQRAEATARMISSRNGTLLSIDSRLREIHLGEWEGMLASDIQRQYPEAWAAREGDPVGFRVPGGETVCEVAARMSAAVDDIAARHPQGLVLLVSHGLALATLVCQARGLPLHQAREVIPDNVDPMEIHWPPDSPSSIPT
jgi:broad specificity phosphatase PhoE